MQLKHFITNTPTWLYSYELHPMKDIIYTYDKSAVKYFVDSQIDYLSGPLHAHKDLYL